MTTSALLSNLWEELAAPSARVFLQALQSRGIEVRASDVREFVASKSERQILQPGNRYEGKVVAFYEGDRHAADLVSFVTKPVTRDGRTFKHLLCTQDMFTRKLRTAPIANIREAEPAFAELLKEEVPRSLTVDKGNEFTNNRFRALAEKEGILLHFKPRDVVNGELSRLDAAIGQLKRNIRRLRELGKGENWLELYERATTAYNNSHHGATGAKPDDLPDSVIFEQRKLAAESAGTNDTAIRERKAKLLKLGGFRVQNAKKMGALRKRADDATWGRRIHLVSGFPQAAVVVDEDGLEYATKRVLAVPLDSSALAADATTLIDRLRPYAEGLREIVIAAGGTAPYKTSVDKLGETLPGLAGILRNARMSKEDFTALFPELLTRSGRSIGAA